MTLPPPDVGDSVAAPGWFPDPETPGVMRWWDGTMWSETDIRVAGEDVHPSWHPASVLASILPRTRLGSIIAHALSAFSGRRSSLE